MDRQEAEAFLGAGEDSTGTIPLDPLSQTGTNAFQFSPLAVQQVARTPNVAPMPRPPGILGNLTPKKAEEQFIQENAAPGIPLDIESGVSPWEKLMLDFRSNKENQIKYLEGKYGPNTVRMSSDGELIVRVPDQENEGKIKDLLVRPHQMKATDFIDLLAAVPEIALSIYAMRKGESLPWIGKKKGALGLAREAAGGAIGSEAAGAAKDIAANLYDVGSPELGQVASERASRLPGMTALGVVGGSVPRLWQWAKNPLQGQRGPLQFDAIAAQKYFKDRYGIDVPMTVGQSTGAPLFGRSEVFIEKMPGGSGPVRQLAKEQESALRRLQEVMMGSSLPTEEELGSRAIGELQPALQRVVQTAETAKQGLSTAAQDAIENKVSSLTAPSRELYHTQTGQAIRGAVVAKRDVAKAEADRLFGIVESLPGGTGKVFDASELQSEFRQILKDLPAPEQMVQKPTGLFDALGKPITVTTKKTETLREFVPPNVLQRLESVVGLKNAKFSLSDLQQMRREVYDDIAKGEGVPGLGTHYLADVGKALTRAIDSGISALPTSDLKLALQAANKHYKEQVIPFNRIGLTELFRNPDELGYVSDSEVVSRLFGGGKATQNWNLVKETIGNASPEFARLKRSVADNILESSRMPGEETIDAKSLIQNLYNFRKNFREISDDVFNKEELELFRQARFLKYAQGDKLNEDELRRLMASGNPTAAKLRNLIVAEKNRDEIYKNQIFKSIGDGTFNEQTLKPSEFLNRMIDNKGVGISEVQDVMNAIQRTNPTLVEDIRRKVYEKIFRDAARSATAGDVNLIMAGNPSHIISGTRIAESLKDKDLREKLKTVLGADGYKDLDQFVKLSAATEMPEQSFRSAGGLAAGTQVAKAERILEQGGILAYVGNVGRSFLFSYMLSNPGTRKWLTNVPSDPNAVTAFLHTLVSSPAFLEAVSKEFPKAPGMQFIHNLKIGMDRSVIERNKTGQQRTGPPEALQKVKKWEEFLNEPAENSAAPQ